MQRTRLFLSIIFIAALFCVLSSAYIHKEAYAQTQGITDVSRMLQSLTPEQRRALEAELDNKGGVLTPESIEMLIERPEFQGLTPDDIMEGKEILEKKEAPEDREISRPEKTEDTGNVIKSLFERYRSVNAYQHISTDLRPFGYDFFAGVDGDSFLPRKDIPVSSDYIIGPGDEVRIMIWGRVNARYNLVVDRDGNITIPQIGPIQVNGMHFREMKGFLAEQADRIVGASMNVTMGALKSIQVFVLGEVRRPASYALDSFSTITSALLAAGGPTEIGSLRRIQLKRNNSTVVEMDFYDFFLRGDKSKDRVLRSGDVVFVMTSGPLVGLAGNVRRPAIYELKEDNDLLSLFKMAGGVIPGAYTQQIQVERILKNEKQVIIDINDRDLTGSGDMKLQDGDLVKVFSIVEKDVNVLYLAGNVKRPGKYEYKPGMKVRDLIRDTSDLLRETHFDYALIKRLRPPGLETQLVPFNLGELLLHDNNAENIGLEPQDSIYIFSTWLFRERPLVTIEGEVRKKGEYELLSNFRLKDAIMEAGGLTKDASMEKGEIFRVNEEGDVTQIYFSVGLVMAEDTKDNLVLQDRDRIIIHSMWEEKQKEEVLIDGEVTNPGKYPLAKGMRVSDLIFSAGNILESAFLDEAEISSFIMEQDGDVNIAYREINLDLALDDDPAHNVLLKPNDRVFVKRILDWKEERFVEVSGEITFPGRYIIKKGETLSSVLERAGGYAENAYLRGAVFIREGVRKMRQKSLEEMILRIEREILVEGSAQASTAFSREEIDARKVELNHKQQFIESLRELKATGRMAIKLAHMRLLKGSKYDIELEDGDSINIPMRSSVVNVIGAVMSRGSFIYSENLDYEDYIDLSGGYTRFADEAHVYVLKVDGTARKLKKGRFQWSTSKDRWELAAFGEELKDIEPGDTIVVPEKLGRIAWLREIKDISQILYQIAITAGVAIAIF